MKVKKTLTTETNKTIKALMITLASMITVLIIVFLFSVNEKAEKGYTLEQQKLKNDQLRSENSKITRQVGSSASSVMIKDSQKLKTMQEVESQVFVTKEDNKVR